MSYPSDPGMIWYVVFHPAKSLWSRRFRHVSLAGYTNTTWIHLDLDRGGVVISPLYRYEDVQDYLSLLLAHYTVLHFGPARHEAAHFFRPMTCVSFVKHVLGVRSGALRPDRLFDDLVRKFNAKVLTDAAENPSGNAGTEATAGQG